MKLVIKKMGDALFARTKVELKRDHNLSECETLGSVKVTGYMRGIYATTLDEHRRIVQKNAVEAWREGVKQIAD